MTDDLSECRDPILKIAFDRADSGNGSLGSDFDDFLREERLLKDAKATAVKRVIAFQIAKEMKCLQHTESELNQRRSK